MFEKDEDFRNYLYLMKTYAAKHEVLVHAYCLMNNHVHFIVTPPNKISLSDLFKNVHSLFSQYKNLQKRRMGHLWQGRFYSCVLGGSHLLRAIRYVEMNPVRAKMVKRPWGYVWSSARQHLAIERSPIVETVFHADCLDHGLNRLNWKEYLQEDDHGMVKEMRKMIQKELVIGDLSFIMKIEKLFNVKLRAGKAGRPKLKK